MQKFDAIIVLGGGIRRSGKLTTASKLRVRKALKLHKEGLAKNIIFCGGETKAVRSEATAMKEYALKKNKKLKGIFLESRSKDTIGNAYFAKRLILKPNKWKKIIVVTAGFHIKRAKYIFRKVLGRGYEVKFAGARTSPKDFAIYRLLRVERSLVELTEIFLKDVNPGDDKEIKKRLLSFHPEYAPKSKLKKFDRWSDEETAKFMNVNLKLVKKYKKFLMKRFKQKM